MPLGVDDLGRGERDGGDEREVAVAGGDGGQEGDDGGEGETGVDGLGGPEGEDVAWGGQGDAELREVAGDGLEGVAQELGLSLAALLQVKEVAAAVVHAGGVEEGVELGEEGCVAVDCEKGGAGQVGGDVEEEVEEEGEMGPRGSLEEDVVKVGGELAAWGGAGCRGRGLRECLQPMAQCVEWVGTGWGGGR